MKEMKERKERHHYYAKVQRCNKEGGMCYVIVMRVRQVGRQTGRQVVGTQKYGKVGRCSQALKYNSLIVGTYCLSLCRSNEHRAGRRIVDNYEYRYSYIARHRIREAVRILNHLGPHSAWLLFCTSIYANSSRIFQLLFSLLILLISKTAFYSNQFKF